MDIFIIHFHAVELDQLATKLAAQGWVIRGHSTVGERAAIGDPLPDVLLLSLDRLPSHALAYADWFWQSKKRQTLPIVFVGGNEQVRTKAQSRYAAANFCIPDELVSTLESLI